MATAEWYIDIARMWGFLGKAKIVVEQRRFSRVPFNQPVEFFGGENEKVHSGMAKDISLGGVFVDTLSAAPFGSAVTLVVALPGLKGPASLPAVVRWRGPAGMGLQFGPLGARETHALTEIVRLGVVRRA